MKANVDGSDTNSVCSERQNHSASNSESTQTCEREITLSKKKKTRSQTSAFQMFFSRDFRYFSKLKDISYHFPRLCPVQLLKFSVSLTEKKTQNVGVCAK